VEQRIGAPPHAPSEVEDSVPSLLSPAGDLIVRAKPAPNRALAAELSVILTRPHGQDSFRALTSVPVWRALGFSPDFRCAEVTVAVPLLDRLWGAYCRRSLMDVSTSEVLESTTSTLQGRLDWGVRRLGPNRSWFTTDADYANFYRTETIRGVSTRGVPFACIEGRDTRGETRSWFGGATFYSIGSATRRASPVFFTEMRTVDLARGLASRAPFGGGYIGYVVGVSPDGRRFVARDYTFHTVGSPICFDYTLYSTSGAGRLLGPPCRDDCLVPVWGENGDPLLVSECDVTTAMRRATLQEDRTEPAFDSEPREIGGRFLVQQGHQQAPKSAQAKGDLLELARDGKHARAIAAGPVSVQWLPDSIVWCEQTTNGGRVVRFYPSDDRYEVLLTVP